MTRDFRLLRAAGLVSDTGDWLGRVLGTYDAGGAAMQMVGVTLAGVLTTRLGIAHLLDLQASLYLLAGALLLAVLGARLGADRRPPLPRPDQPGEELAVR